MKKIFTFDVRTFIIEILIIVTACMQYFLGNPIAKVDVIAFEAACGIGVCVTPEQVEQAVSTPEQIPTANVWSLILNLYCCTLKITMLEQCWKSNSSKHFIYTKYLLN